MVNTIQSTVNLHITNEIVYYNNIRYSVDRNILSRNNLVTVNWRRYKDCSIFYLSSWNAVHIKIILHYNHIKIEVIMSVFRDFEMWTFLYDVVKSIDDVITNKDVINQCVKILCFLLYLIFSCCVLKNATRKIIIDKLLRNKKRFLRKLRNRP